jgi:hypothetical protein
MTYNYSSGAVLAMNATGTLTSGTKALPRITMASGTYTFGDDITSGNGSSAGDFTIFPGTLVPNGKTFTMNHMGGTRVIDTGGQSFYNLVLNGANTKTSIFTTTGFVVTNSFTLAGNSSTNRILFASTTLGTARTITSASNTISNADFRDITGAGAGSWDLSAITGNSGDCGGNSGITFTTAATQTYTGGTDNWSSVAKWTSRVPLPQDDVSMSGVTGGTITADMPRLGKSIDWTGASGTPNWTISSISHSIYGDLKLISGMTLSGNTGITTTFEGRSGFLLTTAGKTFPNALTISMVGGTLTPQDAIGGVSGNFTLTNGSFLNTNNISMQFANLNISGTATKAITLGSATTTVTGSSTSWSFGTTTGLTFNSSGSTIFLSNISATTKTFAGGGLTYNDLQIKAASVGSDVQSITGSNTFNRIYTDGGGTKSITLPGSTTTTLITDAGLENGSNIITFTASAGSATLSKASGLVTWESVNLTNIISTGGATFYAGATPPSVDGGGNTGWIFSSAPVTPPQAIPSSIYFTQGWT